MGFMKDLENLQRSLQKCGERSACGGCVILILAILLIVVAFLIVGL